MTEIEIKGPPPLPVARFRFSFIAEGRLTLPDFPGALWRSALGSAVRRNVCVMDGVPCNECLINSRCRYPAYFEDGIQTENARYHAPPRSIVIKTPRYPDQFETGDRVDISVVLVGEARQDYELIFKALVRVGTQGLTRERVSLRLCEAAQELTRSDGGEWVTLWDGTDIFRDPLDTPLLTFPPAPDRVRLEMISPLRLKRDGKLARPDQFDMLTFQLNLVRRINTLNELYGKDPRNDSPQVDMRSAEIKRNLRWKDQHRYSSRQQSEMKLGGLLGYVDLHGPALTAFWPWLWLGQWLHVGNGATFGLGEYRLRRLRA